MSEAKATDDVRRSVLVQIAEQRRNEGPMGDDLMRAVERWKAWFGRRDEIAGHVLPEVARWEWSTGRRHTLLPLHFERYPGRGRVLKEPPRQRSQLTLAGLAADGRLLTSSTFDYREEAFETFVLHGRPVTDIVEFSPGRRIPLQHGRIEWDGDRVVRFEQLRLNGYTPMMGEKGESPDGLIEWLGPNGRFLLVEQYRYDGEQLREIDCYGEAPGLGPYQHVDRVSWDEGGRVIAIDRTWANGQSQAAYRIRRKGQSLDQLRTSAVAELVPAVVRAVSAAVPTGERVYCIELAYRAADRYHPPLITVGLERDRSTLREPDLTFRPLLGDGRTVDLPDPDALEACRQLDQEVMSRGRWQLGTRMLREAAAQLTRHPWRGTLDVTDDFVAFAIDPEADELEDALRASAPERMAEWRARGWV